MTTQQLIDHPIWRFGTPLQIGAIGLTLLTNDSRIEFLSGLLLGIGTTLALLPIWLKHQNK